MPILATGTYASAVYPAQQWALIETNTQNIVKVFLQTTLWKNRSAPVRTMIGLFLSSNTISNH